jgi:hypothetical protein
MTKFVKMGDLAKQMLVEMRHGRESCAAQYFELEKLRERIFTAARVGYASTLIVIKENVDIQDTASAKAALVWLKEKNIKAEWKRRTGTLPDGQQLPVFDLLVTWDDTVKL